MLGTCTGWRRDNGSNKTYLEVEVLLQGLIVVVLIEGLACGGNESNCQTVAAGRDRSLPSIHHNAVWQEQPRQVGVWLFEHHVRSLDILTKPILIPPITDPAPSPRL